MSALGRGCSIFVWSILVPSGCTEACSESVNVKDGNEYGKYVLEHRPLLIRRAILERSRDQSTVMMPTLGWKKSDHKHTADVIHEARKNSDLCGGICTVPLNGSTNLRRQSQQQAGERKCRTY